MNRGHKKQFSLETAEFAEDSDDDSRILSNQLIEMYNKQYSFMLSQTKNFFADCKDFITRFITYNNMGIGFNLPFMLNTFMKVEAEATSPTRIAREPASWEEKKRLFEGNFANIVKKMGEVIEDLLSFEIKIKMTYLGEAFNSPTKLSAVRPRNSSLSGFLSSNKSSCVLKAEQNENPEQQSKLRSILQKGMSPFNQTNLPVCNIKFSTIENLEKLSGKIENLKTAVENSKQKQQKIWKIFNQKRPSRNMLAEQAPEDDGEYTKLNNMLSDMIFQKNRNYHNSPYATVDSSFR